MVQYSLIRSNRRTLSIEITTDLDVLVRAPLRCSRDKIDRFVAQHDAWIAAGIQRQKQRKEAHPEPTPDEQQRLIQRATVELPKRVAHYAAIMGVKPSGISITGARKRFGSCSGKDRLCFTWRLMTYPDPAIDGVVVHELAHIIHKNHGPNFYALVRKILPDYDERVKLLRE